MAAPSARRKWLIAAAIGCIVLAVGFTVVRGLFAGRYTFVSSLHGTPRFRTYATPPDDVEEYSFTLPAATVLAAMKRDLVADGWNVLYEDSEYAVFRAKKGRGWEIAEFAGCFPMGDGSTCLVTLPKQRTWVANQVEAIKVRLGMKRMLVPFDTGTVGNDLKFDTRVNMTAGEPQVELLWRNRMPFEIKAKVSSLFFRGYEPNVSLPLKMTLKPWQVGVTKLAFPAEAAKPAEDGDLGYSYEYSLASGGGGSGTFGAFPQPLASIFDPSPGKYALVLENRWSDRAMEVKDLSLSIHHVVKFRTAGGLIGPGVKLQIPISASAAGSSKGPFALLEGQVRLLPNRTWAKFRRGVLYSFVHGRPLEFASEKNRVGHH